MKKFTFLLLVTIFTTLNMLAHPGGHYKTEDLPNLHHWTAIADGKLVVGNFMMSKNDVVFVEGINGQIWQVNYQSIVGADKIYVDQEINRINAFNGVKTNPDAFPFNYTPFLIFIFSALTSVVFLIIGIKIRKNQANPFARYSVSFLAVLFFALSLFACKKSNLDVGPTASSPCGVVTGLNAIINPDTTSITLSWNAVSEASSYIINYKKQSETTWNDTSSNINSVILKNLIKDSSYELQVQTICANGNNSMSGTIIVTIPGLGGGSVDSNFIPRNDVLFMDSAYSLYKDPNGTVTTSWDSTYFHISSLGVPFHDKMIGITSWQQQVPIPQFYTDTNSWSIPLQPVYATTPMSTRTNFMKGAVAIAVNGIAIFNALNNRGEDSYAIGELDNWGGHCGRADDYHYHAAPMHLAGPNGRLPIAYALDGFAVYGANEPDGSPMQTLDTCHGHKIGTGVYHYHGTTSYPYVIGAMRGQVRLDPTTPAPENQILPQAFAKGVRPALTPLNGAVITDFVALTPSRYKLTYRRGTKYGYVEYYWTGNGGVGSSYTYILTDTAGVATTNTYTRR